MSLNKSKALRVAEKYVLQGKIPAAIEEYRKVVDADPADLTTINTLGDLYVRAGRIQDAITNFSRIAESYRESGFTLKAIAMLKKISKLDPTNVETAMKLANLYSQQGLLVEARQQYLQVADAYARAGQTRKALEAYQKIADLDPTNTSVRMKLGEIYLREQMTEQAHEAFILAGAEFLRKGDTEQALSANLKAISINSDSRQGLTAIASIYTQMGQANRAIGILCDAFEKNPGDVELLTILGRTYLSAGMMDDAERTFLSLVELDRNRYHYLLEVGRRFLQLGDLDRAAEQIDGCLDVLIGKREEDKAIDFLRRVLDRDMNHIGSLKRLAQIFLRIREDHNLVATLNSLAEAAMRKGEDHEAIAALTELARLEPDEALHRQRLYNLGVRDIVESESPEVVRATGPLDYESAAFDDAFVIRQISEAEILAGHGQVEHAVTILQEILNHTPDNVQVHLKLKDIYLRASIVDKAAEECLELSRIYEARGESSRASDFMAEARQLNPLIEEANPGQPGWSDQDVRAFAFEDGFAAQAEAPHNGDGFEMREATGGLDLTKYQTGPLTDHTGFVTVPEGAPLFAKGEPPSNGANAAGTQAFRYSDTLIGDAGDPQPASPVAEMVFTSAANLPSDTMSRILRDELEGIDFYLAQGYIEIARDTLDRLRDEHGDHPEIVARYHRLGINIDSEGSLDEPADARDRVYAEADHVEVDMAAPADDQPPFEAFMAEPVSSGNGHAHLSQIEPQAEDVSLTVEEAGAPEQREPFSDASDFTVQVSRSPKEGERKHAMPFMITKESGPLQADLMVQLNTSELLTDTPFDALRQPTGALNPIVGERFGTGDLIESIVSNMDASFESIQQHKESAPLCIPKEMIHSDQQQAEDEEPQESSSSYVTAALPALDAVAPIAAELQPSDSETDLGQIFEELKENTGELKPLIDFETHYSLGLAYKDMDLLDEAIEQFQMAFRRAGDEDLHGSYIQCCHMLGVCFKRKSMPKVAIMWFQRGLKIPNRTEDEYQALRYEIGVCYEEIGDTPKAIDAYMEVYGIDVNYREVGEKIKQLQASNPA